MKYYNNLQNVISKHLFLLVTIIMFLVSHTIGANPGSPVLTNASIGFIFEKSKQVTDITGAAYVLPCKEPGASASVSGNITCYSTVVTLTGNSPASGATYSWSGPDGFTSESQFTFVTIPGKYILTVISNDCMSKDSVTVLMDVTPPAVEASVSGVLDEYNVLVELSGTSSNPNVLYFWTGPDDFISVDETTYAVIPGIYTLTATDPLNGCTGIASVEVLEAYEKSSSIAEMRDVTKDFQIRTYPNPFTDKAFMEFTPEQSANVTIELFSANGNLQRVLFNGYVEAQQPYKVIINGADMVAGTYYFVIKTDTKKEVYSEKILLIK